MKWFKKLRAILPRFSSSQPNKKVSVLKESSDMLSVVQVPYEAMAEEAKRDARQNVSHEEWFNPFLLKWAGRIKEVWESHTQQITMQLTQELLRVESIKTEIAYLLRNSEQKITEARLRFVDEIREIYTRRITAKYEEETRVRALTVRIRTLKIAMTGNPEREVVVPELLQRWLFTILALTVTLVLEFLLNFGIYQSESNSNTSLAVSLVITLVGTLGTFYAAEKARQERDYRNALSARNAYYRESPGTVDTQKVDPVTGRNAYVEPPGHDRQVLSYIAHGFILLFALLVLVSRIYVLRQKTSIAEVDDILSLSLGSLCVFALWVGLYLFERNRHYVGHASLPEYETMQRELSELTRSAKNPNPLEVLFRTSMEEARRVFSTALYALKASITQKCDELKEAQKRVGLLSHTASQSQEYARAYMQVVTAGLIERVALHPTLASDPKFDLSDERVQQGIVQVLFAIRPQPDLGLAERIEHALLPVEEGGLAQQALDTSALERDTEHQVVSAVRQAQQEKVDAEEKVREKRQRDQAAVEAYAQKAASMTEKRS